LPIPSLILVTHDDNGGPPATLTKADRPSPCACCYYACPGLVLTHWHEHATPSTPPADLSQTA
jgi:hypothetical protein